MGVDAAWLLWTYVCVCVCVCLNCGTAGKVWPGLRFSTEITVSGRKSCVEKQGGREGKKRREQRRDEEEEGGHLVMICVY